MIAKHHGSALFAITRRLAAAGRRLWPVAVPVGILAIGILGSFAQPTEDWRTAVSEHLERRELQAASARLTAVLAADPTDRDALRFRAMLRAEKGELVEALAEVESLLVLHPNDRQAMLLQSHWLQRLGRLTEALEVCMRRLEGHPDDPEMRVRRVEIWLRQGDASRAMVELEAILETQPAAVAAQRLLIDSLAVLDRGAEAWRHAEQFDRESEHLDAGIGLTKARLLAQLGANDLAMGLAVRPTTDPDIARQQSTFRAGLLVRTGRVEEGLNLLAGYADAFADAYESLIDAGKINIHADQPAAARVCYERAVRLAPERPEAQLGLARLARHEGRVEDAKKICRAVLARKPEVLDASIELIELARLSGDQDSATATLAAARQRAPRAIQLHRLGLLLALDAGDLGAFAKELGNYEASHPTDPNAAIWGQRWQAMETAAIDFNQLVARLDPFSPDATDSALALLAATPAADGITTFRDWSRDASLPARTELFLTLARKAALRADRDWTGRFVQLAREAHAIESARGSHEAIRNKPNSERAQFMMPEILASGWWAYLAEPFSWQSALSRELDPAIVDGWLAGEVRERIQKMTSDSGSPLGEEWLLRRAVWAAAWKGREHTPEAAASWHEYLGSMIPGAFEVAAPPEIGEAWRIADRGSAQERPDGGLQTARARWNEARTNVAATLQPLAGVDADEARLRQLVALVTTDDSGVGSLRRLYLRDDPFEERRRAMLRGLQPADQWGFIAGIDYHDPRRRAGATAPSEWHELFAGVDWQPMAGAGWGLEYRRIEQRVWNDTRLRVDTRIALDDDWIVRGHAAPALDGEHIARLKTGGGVSRRLGDSWFATLNYEWTKFSDLDAHRFAPGLAWRWHPRSTIEAGIDLVHSVPRSGDREWTPIGSVTADWKFSEDFVARLHVELGDRSRANPVRELVGTDQDFGLGFDLRVPVASRWFLVPSWSYERHERFELHTFGLGVVYGR